MSSCEFIFLLTCQKGVVLLKFTEAKKIAIYSNTPLSCVDNILFVSLFKIKILCLQLTC